MPTPFSHDMLDQYRQQGDVLADTVIATFASEYQSSVETLLDKMENMIRLPADEYMTQHIRHAFADNPAICQALETYFEEATTVPDWLDPAQLLQGTRVFQDHVFSSIIILGCASLPTTYVCWPEVKVLGFTRRLIDDAPRRLVETAQMITDVMGEHNLQIMDGQLHGKGVQSILKIRLIHAAVRYLFQHRDDLLHQHGHDTPLRQNTLSCYLSKQEQQQCRWHGEQQPESWDNQQDGVPINQESLAIILLTFSYTILRGLHTIGVRLPQQQQDAYIHSWNVVGHLLGVDEQFLLAFNNYPACEQVYQQIMQRRRRHSEDGHLLEDALLNAFVINAVNLTPFARLLHVRRLARLITTLLIEKESQQALCLKLSPYDRLVRFFVWMGLRSFGFLVNHKIVRPLANFMFGRIARSLWDWRNELPTDDVRSATGRPLHLPRQMSKSSDYAGSFATKGAN